MKTITVNPKYSIGEQVFVLYENKVRCVNINRFDITIKSKRTNVNIISKVFNIVDSIESISILYEVKLITRSDEGTAYRQFFECDVYKTKQELTQSL